MADADKYTSETITWFKRWTPSLFSFRLSRPAGFRFVPGQFARLGITLPDADRMDASATTLVWRAYSVVSASDDDFLEFYSIVVPDGAFTSRLATMGVGDRVLVDRTSFGFLTTERFAQGRDLWMLSTGTGLAPFISILQEASVWKDYENLVVAHSVREPAELIYRDTILRFAEEQRHAGPGARLHYVPIVTRRPCAGALQARLPQLIEDGRLVQAAGLPLSVEASRVMICGNPGMVAETRKLLAARGFSTSRRGQPGNLAVENYW